jgi:hypothetical protein
MRFVADWVGPQACDRLWLGDQDSNLDKVLQRHLTYH